MKIPHNGSKGVRSPNILKMFKFKGILHPGKQTAGWNPKIGGLEDDSSYQLSVSYQPLPRGANETLRDCELTPFRNHLAPKLEGPGRFHVNFQGCRELQEQHMDVSENSGTPKSPNHPF